MKNEPVSMCVCRVGDGEEPRQPALAPRPETKNEEGQVVNCMETRYRTKRKQLSKLNTSCRPGYGVDGGRRGRRGPNREDGYI